MSTVDIFAEDIQPGDILEHSRVTQVVRKTANEGTVVSSFDYVEVTYEGLGTETYHVNAQVQVER